METTLQDVIILGAGPSGLFCALHLPKKANVLLLEKTQKSATKLLLSAKGRGNLTNRNVNPMEDYVSDNNKFVKSAFENYGVQDFLSFLDQAGFPTREEENGRILLQSGKVAQFHEFLLKKVAEQGKTIAYQQDIQDLEKNADGTFTVKTASSQFLTHNVILATGTKSIPILGSSDIALQIAHKFNLPFRDFFPALVGLETQENLSELSGSSLLGKGELYENGKCIYQET
ncbi:MAG: NAD(P)/FAD-dependent oxidoreductase [Candidatus Peribacteria bacterium]|jgi:predicted Rossmann fold flavoprotein|nr:NAD(P)/FAD-dependent oxidoreductase [Candidatus Peribacteria bacterium]